MAKVSQPVVYKPDLRGTRSSHVDGDGDGLIVVVTAVVVAVVAASVVVGASRAVVVGGRRMPLASTNNTSISLTSGALTEHRHKNCNY